MTVPGARSDGFKGGPMALRLETSADPDPEPRLWGIGGTPPSTSGISSFPIFPTKRKRERKREDDAKQVEDVEDVEDVEGYQRSFRSGAK